VGTKSASASAIAQGYATLGPIGFEGRFDYTAIGTVTNVAARLCAEAKDSQILVTQRVAAAIDNIAELQHLGDIALRGPQPSDCKCSTSAGWVCRAS